MANKFVDFPLDKLTNRENFVTRLEKVEQNVHARPSATVVRLDELGGLTGDLVVDGSITIIDPETGNPIILLDTGGITQFNGAESFVFEDASGNTDTIYMSAAGDNALGLYNLTSDGSIKQTVKLTDTTTPYVKFWEDVSNTNMAELQINAAATPTVLVIGGDNNSEGNAAIAIYANIDGKETVFNANSYDIDHRFEGATDANLLKLDAGTDRVGIGTNAPDTKLHVVGNVKVTDGIMAETGSTNVYAVSSPGGPSTWTGTINGAPSGANVTVSAPITGTEGVLVPIATGYLAKMTLYNTTRGNSALISNYNTGTNVVTLTANAPADWVNGDSLTVASQTVTGGGIPWVDMEITAGLTSRTSVFIRVTLQSATVAGNAFFSHPYETYNAAGVQRTDVHVANVLDNDTILIKITGNKFAMGWLGAITTLIIRESGFMQ